MWISLVALSALPQNIIKSLGSKGLNDLTVKSLVASAEKSIKSWSPIATPFLSGFDCNVAKNVFSDILDLKVDLIGGYRLADRQRVLFSQHLEVNYLQLV